MKRTLALLSFFTLATLLMTGCEKEVVRNDYHTHQVNIEQTQVFQGRVALVARGYQVATGELMLKDGWYDKTDAVLVYSKADNYWTPMPYTMHGMDYYYLLGESGNIIKFEADAGEGFSWDSDFVMDIKVVIIPGSIVGTIAKSVNLNNYDEVAKYFNL